MKLSFEKGTPEYIGNEFQEYKNAGFFKEKSLSVILKERADSIKYKDTLLYQFTTKLIQKDTDIESSDYWMIIQDIHRGKIKSISKEDYGQITNEINKDYPELGGKYIDDFALFVIYAKKNCFKEVENYIERRENFYSRELREKILNFYARIANNEIDISNITIKYNENKIFGNYENLVLDSPIIIKVMLYQFAKRYFTLFQKKDENNWEEDIGKREVAQTVDNRKNFDSQIITAIIHLYDLFISEINDFDKFSNYKKYGLIGRLLTIAGYKDYDEFNSYQNKNKFYYQTLKYFWKIGQNN